MRKRLLLKRDTLIFSKEGGKTAKRICEPSRGGIGNKLNTPRTMLSQTKIRKKATSPTLDISKKRKGKPTNKAIKKLEPGPAKPTRAGPHF